MCENNKCEICNKNIEVGMEQYSCELMEEFYEDGAYTSIKADGVITTCTDCQEKFNIDEEIDKKLITLINKSDSNIKKQNNVMPINNHYACKKCNTPIRDGDPLVTINHYREIWNHGVIEPVKVWISYHMCKQCSNNLDIRSSIVKVVDKVIGNSKHTNDQALTKYYY